MQCSTQRRPTQAHSAVHYRSLQHMQLQSTGLPTLNTLQNSNQSIASAGLCAATLNMSTLQSSNQGIATACDCNAAFKATNNEYYEKLVHCSRLRIQRSVQGWQVQMQSADRQPANSKQHSGLPTTETLQSPEQKNVSAMQHSRLSNTNAKPLKVVNTRQRAGMPAINKLQISDK